MSGAYIAIRGTARRERGWSALNDRELAAWVSWQSMRSRCLNPRHNKFGYYGGRGIRISVRWDSFRAFLADMGPRPIGRTLDRIDNNGHYEPGNCRWATSREQARNTRRYVPPEVRALRHQQEKARRREERALRRRLEIEELQRIALKYAPKARSA